MIKPELTEEDKQRVKDYLESNPLHQKERKSFKLGYLFIFLVAIVSLLSVFSIVVGRFYFNEL